MGVYEDVMALHERMKNPPPYQRPRYVVPPGEGGIVMLTMLGIPRAEAEAWMAAKLAEGAPASPEQETPQ